MLKDTDGLVGTFDGGYGRVGQIWMDFNTCDLCGHEDTLCINIDGSEGEYECGSVCELCTKKVFWDPYKAIDDLLKKCPPGIDIEEKE